MQIWKQICLRGRKQTSANDSICYILCMEESLLARVTTSYYAGNTIMLSFPQIQHTYSWNSCTWDINSQVPNIVLYCHRDESSLRRQHLFAALSQLSAHINTLMLRAASETGTESVLLIKLKCSEWNIVRISTLGLRAKPGIQIGCCIREGICWVFIAKQVTAVRDFEMQLDDLLCLQAESIIDKTRQKSNVLGKRSVFRFECLLIEAHKGMLTRELAFRYPSYHSVWYANQYV